MDKIKYTLVGFAFLTAYISLLTLIVVLLYYCYKYILPLIILSVIGYYTADFCHSIGKQWFERE